jgi:hypothetical protein
VRATGVNVSILSSLSSTPSKNFCKDEFVALHLIFHAIHSGASNADHVWEKYIFHLKFDLLILLN